MSRAAAQLARRGISLVGGRPGAWHSALHTSDVGSAVEAALHAPPGVYNVVDDEPMRRAELRALLAESAGRRRLLRPGGACGACRARADAPADALPARVRAVASRRPPAGHRRSPAVVPLAAGVRRAMTLARLLLGLLAAFAAVIGVWARFAPKTFYTDFPVGGWDWVSRLGPYNEHLVGDFGGTTLALAAMTAIAVARPHRKMVVAACVGWEVAPFRT